MLFFSCSSISHGEVERCHQVGSHEQEPGQPSQYPDEQEDEPEEDEPEEAAPEAEPEAAPEAAPEATLLRAPCSVLRANTLYPDYL